MKQHQASYPVATMCRLLDVSSSGYYAWRDRAPSARDLSDADLLQEVRRIHDASRQTYGAPRIHAELAEQGRRVGRKRVARLMRAAQLQGVSRRRSSARGAPAARESAPAADLVGRDFTAEHANELWVADIT